MWWSAVTRALNEYTRKGPPGIVSTFHVPPPHGFIPSLSLLVMSILPFRCCYLLISTQVLTELHLKASSLTNLSCLPWLSCWMFTGVIFITPLTYPTWPATRPQDTKLHLLPYTELFIFRDSSVALSTVRWRLQPLLLFSMQQHYNDRKPPSDVKYNRLSKFR